MADKESHSRMKIDDIAGTRIPVTRIKKYLVKVLNSPVEDLAANVIKAGDRNFKKTEGLEKFLREFDNDFPKREEVGGEMKSIPNIDINEFKTAEELATKITKTCKFRLGIPTAVYVSAVVDKSLEILIRSGLQQMLSTNKPKSHFHVHHIVRENMTPGDCSCIGLFNTLPTWVNYERDARSRKIHTLAQEAEKELNKLQNKIAKLEANAKNKTYEEHKFEAQGWPGLDESELIPVTGYRALKLRGYVKSIIKSIYDEMETPEDLSLQIKANSLEFLEQLAIDLTLKLLKFVYFNASLSARKTVPSTMFAAVVSGIVEFAGGDSYEILNFADECQDRYDHYRKEHGDPSDDHEAETVEKPVKKNKKKKDKK